MANPFQITKPVEPAEVINRDSETDQLKALAEEGNNARLVAPRRYGKTSLLRRVQGELARGDWETVYVDLLGIVTLEDFAGRIERAYTYVLTGAAARWFLGLRRSLRPTFTLGGGPIPASGAVDLTARGREALVDRLNLPVKVFEKTGRRVHVVYDEFQELLSVDDGADAVVRSQIQHHGNAASYVFAGSHLKLMETLFTDRRRAFYAQTQLVSLTPFDTPPLVAYLSEKFEQTAKELGPEALDPLLNLVQGHPQRAMAAAHALWDVTDRVAGIEEWEVARGALSAQVADEMRATWVELGAKERQALVAVALGEGPYQRGAGRSRGGAVAHALDSLQGRGVLRRVETGWYVVDPLLADWVRAGRHSP